MISRYCDIITTMNQILYGIILILFLVIILMWGNMSIDNRLDLIDGKIVKLQNLDQNIINAINRLHNKSSSGSTVQ